MTLKHMWLSCYGLIFFVGETSEKKRAQRKLHWLCCLILLSGTQAVAEVQTDPLAEQVDILGEQASQDPAAAAESLRELHNRGLDTLGLRNYAAVLQHLCFAERVLGNIDRSGRIADEGLSQTDPELPAKPRGYLLACKAFYASHIGESQQATNLYQQALSLAVQNNLNELLGFVYQYRGYHFLRNGDYQASLRDFQDAFRLFRDEIRNMDNAYAALMNMALVYARMDDSHKAIENLKSAAGYFESKDNFYVLSTLYNNLARQLYKAENYEEAGVYARQAISLNRQLADEYALIKNYLVLADILAATGTESEALTLAEQSIEQAVTHDFNELAADAVYLKAKILFQQNRLAQALAAVSALASDLPSGWDKRSTLELYQLLYKIHKQKRDYAQALVFLEKSRVAGQELMSSETQKEVARLNAVFERERLENELRFLEQENQLKQQVLAQKGRTSLYLQVFVGLLTAVGLALVFFLRRSVRYARKLEILSCTDALTGKYNRFRIGELLRKEIARQERYGGGLSILVIDIDHFKQINDRFGHPQGDKVICHIADCIDHLIRETDTLGRIGGEEFLVILPATAADEALKFAQRLCQNIVYSSSYAPISELDLSVSVGVAEYGNKEGIDKLYERADAALYQAKTQGRNRAVVTS